MAAAVDVDAEGVDEVARGEAGLEGFDLVGQRTGHPLGDLGAYFGDELGGERPDDGLDGVGLIGQCGRGRLGTFVVAGLCDCGEAFTVARGPALVDHAGESGGFGGQLARLGDAIHTDRRVRTEHGHQVFGRELFLVPRGRKVREREPVLQGLHVGQHHRRRSVAVGTARGRPTATTRTRAPTTTCPDQTNNGQPRKAMTQAAGTPRGARRAAMLKRHHDFTWLTA